MALCLSRPSAFLRSRQLQLKNYNHPTVSSEYLDLRRQFLQLARRLYERERERTGGMEWNRPERRRKREGNQEHLRVPPSTTFFVISSRKIAQNSRPLSVRVSIYPCHSNNRKKSKRTIKKKRIVRFFLRNIL